MTTEHPLGPEIDADSLRRRIRLVMILDAAESAGLTPIPVLRLHTLAFLTNVLAPVWNMPVLSGKLLKRRGGPFYPSLQADLDRLVGEGVAAISAVSHLKDEEGRWRLEGAYRFNPTLSEPILSALRHYPDEAILLGFVRELALALSALADEDLDSFTREDAAYSDPRVDYGGVVDFAEWRRVNCSANAANSFNKVMPSDVRSTPGERLHLYVRHLATRLHGAK
jgi:hypothetical protein